MELNKLPAKPAEITEARYTEATDGYEGWCTVCRDFTRDQTEPDAHDYDCPVCDNKTVVGAEDALIMGLFTFKEEG